MTLASGSSSSIVTLRDSFFRTGALPVWCRIIVTAEATKSRGVNKVCKAKEGHALDQIVSQYAIECTDSPLLGADIPQAFIEFYYKGLGDLEMGFRLVLEAQRNSCSVLRKKVFKM